MNKQVKQLKYLKVNDYTLIKSLTILHTSLRAVHILFLLGSKLSKNG